MGEVARAKKPKTVRWDRVGQIISTLANVLPVPPGPYFILGNTVNPNDVAKALETSPFSDQLFRDGVLFVPQVFVEAKESATPRLTGRVYRLAIEGVGPDPNQAVLNTVSGANLGDIRDLSAHFDEFFSAHYPPMPSGLKRAKHAEVGFFIRVAPDGTPHVHREQLNMPALRASAFAEYARLNYMANSVYTDNLDRAFAAQSYYEEALNTYQAELIRAERLASLSKAIEHRREAVRSLREAQVHRERAQKYSKRAQALAVVSTLLATGESAYAASVSEAQSKAIADAQNSIDALSQRNKELLVEINNLNKLSEKVEIDFRSVIINMPVPDSQLPPILP